MIFLPKWRRRLKLLSFRGKVTVVFLVVREMVRERYYGVIPEHLEDWDTLVIDYADNILYPEH